MKQKTGFNLRDICGEKVIVPQGKENIDFTNIISMNATAAFLWDALQGKDFELRDIVRLLTDNYEVDKETAEKDARELMLSWQECGIVE